MNHSEIMKALLEGKKIKFNHEDFDDTEYFYLNEEGTLVSHENKEFPFEVLNQCEIYEPQKPKVEKYLWNVKTEDSKYWELCSYYFSEKELQDYFKDVQFEAIQTNTFIMDYE